MRALVKNSFYGLQRRVARWQAALSTASGRLPHKHFVLFNLHAICEAPSEMAVRPAAFRRQLTALLNAGYRCLSLADALDCAAGVCPLPHAAFVLTFDDGYRSVYENAFPILQELGLTATVFVTVNFLNGRIAPPWGAEDAALRREYSQYGEFFRPLEWSHLGELLRSGCFHAGSHSLNHQLLATLDQPHLDAELRDSRRILEDRTGAAVVHLSYPYGVRAYGAYSERTEVAVRAAGYRCSITAEIGRVRAGMGTWLLPRISLVNADSGADACAKAAGAYDWVAVPQRVFQRVFPNPHQRKHEDSVPVS